LSARGLARLEVETAVVCEIEARGAAYLVELKSKQRSKIDLDQVEESLMPNNPTVPPLAMTRLFQHICKEARDRRFDSSINLIQPYREEALEDVFKLQNLQKIALWLGILGTFVGLLLALSAGQFGGSPDDRTFLTLIQGMFDGLFVSFSASIAGLEAAVLLGFFLLFLRKRQETYFTSMETATVTMLSVARHAENRDDVVSELTQVSTMVGQLSDRVHEQTKALDQRLKQLYEKVQTQNERLDRGLTELATAKAHFDGFLTSLSDAQRDFVKDVISVYDAVAMKDLSSALQAGVARAGTEVANRLGETTAHTTKQLAQFNETIGGLRVSLDAQQTAFTTLVKGFNEQLTTATTKNMQALTTAIQQGKADAARYTSGVQVMATNLPILTERLSELNKSLNRMGYAPTKRSRVWDYIASLKGTDQ
jgi:hypothetical protein